MEKETVISREYVVEAEGQQCHELVRAPDGSYYVAIKGRCENADARLSIEEARAVYDDSPKKLGARP